MITSQRAIKNNFPEQEKYSTNIYIYFNYGVQYIYKICKIIINVSGIYLIWIVLHFVAWGWCSHIQSL